MINWWATRSSSGQNQFLLEIRNDALLNTQGQGSLVGTRGYFVQFYYLLCKAANPKTVQLFYLILNVFATFILYFEQGQEIRSF